MNKKLKKHQVNVYAIYHNLYILALFNKKDKLVTTGKGDLKVCRYALKGDRVSKKYITKCMKFDQFMLLIKRYGFSYFNYYRNPKKKYNYHFDAYKTFTKRELDEFLKGDTTEMKENYSFLNI